MRWGFRGDEFAIGVHQLSGRGDAAHAYRRRRCALVLTGYELDAHANEPLRWSGPPTLFAGLFEMDVGIGPRCALVVVERRPVPMTLDEADRWNLVRENNAIDDAITLEKVNEILRRP